MRRTVAKPIATATSQYKMDMDNGVPAENETKKKKTETRNKKRETRNHYEIYCGIKSDNMAIVI